MEIPILLANFLYITNVTTIDSDNTASYNYYLLNIGEDFNHSLCYGIYGCFSLASPWTSEHRPVSYYPENINKIEPNFLLFSRRNRQENEAYKFDLNEPDVIKASGINADLPLYVISHGFLEGGNKPWIHEMTARLLNYHNCNVIVVDWHTGSGPPYTQAVANIRLVGAITAHLLGDLVQHTSTKRLDHVHMIGHSLGAHLSGYVGYTLQEVFNVTLGRISGLDPAEPHFAKSLPPVRLDRSAAHYVDIIHTDASAFIRGGLGITEHIGHIDFYPNGGTNQPGCDKTVGQYTSESGSFFQGIRKFLGCNHLRSHEYFSESINTKCQFLTIACKSYDEFKKGSCFQCGQNGQHCVSLGFHSIRGYNQLTNERKISRNDSLVQYLITGEKEPFCKAHYRVTVKISASRESLKHGGEVGQLWFTMHPTNDNHQRHQQQQQQHRGLSSERVPLNEGGYHEPGATYTSVVAASSVSPLRAVEVEWQYHSSMFNPLTWRLLASARVHVEQVIVEQMETGERLVACSKSNKPLIAGVSQLYLASYCM